ncbi:glycoside hydrolase family 2 TIM barrel-domain containing protein [Paenibacillus sp. J2TS4]|uniref:glycoside hydrolase family 2 TIM barrel-domain containing protein n=1 Tax=Paenibacillus sp. J2TS4 TaxID=2807194 RepID=UPI001B025B1B|nr:glycoside hydrolase family 2 TIM barrel-domain containing protein [Paenibacillus sp. J2TS4]GIP33260.1 beta-galactosidase [Paenibacillus sp. J2TS4]
MITNRLNNGWEHYRGSLGGVWEVWRQYKLNNHYNVPWMDVELPHCFNGEDSVDPDVLYYEGPGWYRTLLEVNNPYPNGRTLLHFEGAGQDTDVYLYTSKVARHVGGYDEFKVDLTDAIEERKYSELFGNRVPVAVQCDNTRNLETIPSDISDFNLYGGIYRYLNLVYVPEISFEYIHIDTEVKSQNKADITVKARLYNPQGLGADVRLTIVVRDPQGQELHRHEVTTKAWEGWQELAVCEIADVKLWSPDTPALYTCEVSMEGETNQQTWTTRQTERFGLRTFEFVKQGPFLLNGERLLLKGTHRHEDFAGVAAAMTEDMIRREMGLIKEMGANFIRLGHYQQSRIVLELCDELGLLVWEEIPWCRGGIGGETYRQQARNMLKAMIEQHYNHPSVIIWGLGNENDWESDFDTFDEEEIRQFMKELHDLSHSLDDSRVTGIRRCEFCKDIIDVYSPSIWAGWYRGIYPEYESSSRAGFEGTDRFLHLEWGADNMTGRHVEEPYTGFSEVKTGAGADERDGDYFLQGGDPRVSSLGDWSETYFCDMIDWYLKSQEKMEWLTGAAQWAFKDFSTPVRPDSPIPYLNMKGVVQRDLTPKEAFYVFQSYWTEQPMIRLYSHTMAVRWGRPGEKKLMKVYSNCEEVELFVNGESCGIRQRNTQDFPCAGLRWEVELAAGENHVQAVGRKDGVRVSDEIRFTYQTEAWEEPESLTITASRQKDGLVKVEVKAFDRHGVYCPDANHFIRFGLAGEGKLLDNRGTINGSRYLQLASGRAAILVDPREGRSVVSASSDGMQTVFVEV